VAPIESAAAPISESARLRDSTARALLGTPSAGAHRRPGIGLDEFHRLEQSSEMALCLRKEAGSDFAHDDLGDDRLVTVLEDAASRSTASASPRR
jgi:hypothetical protein